MPIAKRGPRRFFYTYDTLAALVGWNRDQVMRSKRAGQFDPESLESVVDWSIRVETGVTKPAAPRYGKART